MCKFVYVHTWFLTRKEIFDFPIIFVELSTVKWKIVIYSSEHQLRESQIKNLAINCKEINDNI